MIYHGDLFNVLPKLDADSIDACSTDPPYGIGVMGKEWDTFAPETIDQLRDKADAPNPNQFSETHTLKGRKRRAYASPSAIGYDKSLEGQRAFQAWTERWASEIYRVLKPGAHILVCGAPRSFHRMTSGLEDAGFVIRDCFSWLYGSGFPKSLNIDGGRGTALKPAWEPIVLARKPLIDTIEVNVGRLRHWRAEHRGVSDRNIRPKGIPDMSSITPRAAGRPTFCLTKRPPRC